MIVPLLDGWHRSLPLDNGFTAADVVWRRGNEALMVAVTS
jgi:hypothetical protein